MKLKKIFIYVLMILSSMSMVFNVWTYSSIFYLIENKKIDWILYFLVIVILGYTLFPILEYMKSININSYIRQIMLGQKKQIFENILYKKSDATNDISDNISLLTSDFKFIEDNYYNAKFKYVEQLLAGTGALIFALYNNWILTLVFIAFGIIPVFTANINSKKIELTATNWSKVNQDIVNYAKDFFRNKLAIKVYNSIDLEMDKTYNLLTKLENENAEKKNQVELANMLSRIIGYIVFFIPIILGIYYAIIGKISLSSFVAVQYSSSWIINYFMGAIRVRNQIRSSKPIYLKINSLLEDKHKFEEFPKINSIDKIEFKNVSFSFNEKEIFKDLNLVINKGEKVLIKGESGSGKTTLLKLMLKIIEPTSGTIYINDRDIKNISELELISYYGLINQNPYIFNDTILKNITFGMNFSESEIEDAVKKAGLESLINDKGYDYIVGEEGKLLSGGQLKRLEIARAILFGRNIFLVDELNASLDRETAKNINEIIINTNKTVIDIEHHAFDDDFIYDKKIVLKDKKVIFI